MIDNETVRKLRQLDLSEFVDTLEMQEMDQDTRHLPFDERLQLSIDYLYQEKYNKRVSGLTVKALKNWQPTITLIIDKILFSKGSQVQEKHT